MPNKVVITGANRGIGLGLVKYFVSKGSQVTATARNPGAAKELRVIAAEYPDKCRIETLDVLSDLSAAALAEKCRADGVDILINNAGVLHERDEQLDTITPAAVIESFNVNAVGTMRMTKAFLPILQNSKKPIIANITSKMGSISDNTSGGSYAYRMSKAALNMFNKCFSVDYPNITSVVLHPGWVKTDMGGSSAPLSVELSANSLGNLISEFSPKDSGKFLDYHGNEIPW